MAHANFVYPSPKIWALGGFQASGVISVCKAWSAAAENYTQAVRDLISLVPITGLAPGALRNTVVQAQQVIKYYYGGMQISLASRPYVGPPTLDEETWAGICRLSLNILDAALMLLGIYLESTNVDGGLPNRDVMELVVMAKYLSLADRPTDLESLQKMLVSTNVGQLWTHRNNDDLWNTGLPSVIFPCLIQPSNLIIGVSTADWSVLKKVASDVKAWRDARFSGRLNDRGDLQECGTKVKSAFDLVYSRVKKDTQTDLYWRLLNNPGSVLEKEWNELVQEVFGTLGKDKSKNPYAFNHNSDKGRPFLARGPSIFQPTSRCWKCRFLHLYNTNDPPFPIEEPHQTKFVANKALDCAEDLCHYYCRGLHPLSGDLIWPAAAELPYVLNN